MNPSGPKPGQSSEVDEPITLVEADPRWPALYLAEAERVRGVIGDVATRIEHVGSTAVPGLGGKPIVDLLVGVRALDEGKAAALRLVAIGYENFGEVFIPGRLYLRRRGEHAFNLAVAEEGGAFLRSQLAVRDYLRARPDEVRAYAEEKRRAYEQGARLFSSYSQKKHAFLVALTDRALAWAGASGG
jgi:GrpB-like predicted nucleotidyltransferase (UPF0157 family)